MRTIPAILASSSLLLALGCAPAEVSTAAESAQPTWLVDTSPMAGAWDDVARMVKDSNAERVNAVTELLEDRGFEYTLQSVENPGRARDPREEGSNVIVTLGEGDRDIVIGAHFDAVPLDDGTHSHGVVDNGASVVVLTRLAETLRDLRLNHRIRIVFFDMEEIGLVGSRAFVESPEAENVVAMVNLDVTSSGDAIIYGPGVGEGNEVVYSELRGVCAGVGITCIEFPNYPGSDDRSFQAAGIPNVSIGIVPEVEAHQLWLLLNGGEENGLASGFVPGPLATIHTPGDRLDKVEQEAMETVYTTTLNLVLQLDETME